MLRSIIAVIVSCIVMAILTMGVFAGLWFGLGPDGLFQPGSFKASTLSLIAAPAVTVITRFFGGWLCAKIGRGRGPVMVLAGIVLVLGLVMAYFTIQMPEPTGPRDPGMTADQVLDKAREPAWLALFNPIGGAAAVLIGGLCMGGAARRKPR